VLLVPVDYFSTDILYLLQSEGWQFQELQSKSLAE